MAVIAAKAGREEGSPQHCGRPMLGLREFEGEVKSVTCRITSGEGAERMSMAVVSQVSLRKGRKWRSGSLESSTGKNLVAQTQDGNRTSCYVPHEIPGTEVRPYCSRGKMMKAGSCPEVWRCGVP